ncbi:MAG: hypothetical protein HQK50_16755 [Oligoflexia bacterium]|nr:hypothetical protein [Oligoflexia bacterium]MBF0367229.1 hypothetical protein [Oligoflexia bacterium]
MNKYILFAFSLLFFVSSCTHLDKHAASKDYPSLVDDPERYINNLYFGVNGYIIGDEDAKKIKDLHYNEKNTTYGEITYNGAQKLFQRLNLTEHDVFYDLGSGVGKLVVQAFLTTPVKKAAGIELIASRAQEAQKALEALVQDGVTSKTSRIIMFEEKDILKSQLGDATVLFWSNLTWEKRVINNIMKKILSSKHKMRLASLVQLEASPYLVLKETTIVDVTWNRYGSTVYIYEIN